MRLPSARRRRRRARLNPSRRSPAPTRMPTSAIALSTRRSNRCSTEPQTTIRNLRRHEMSTGFFGDIQKIKYEGPESTNPLAFRHYNPDEIVLGKRMKNKIKIEVTYW